MVDLTTTPAVHVPDKESLMRLRFMFFVVAGSALAAVALATGGAAAPPPPPPPPPPHGPHTTTVVYDNFSTGGADHAAKWANAFGLGEIASPDASHFLAFPNGAEEVKAVPFKTGADFSVFDHIKYLETSTTTFPVPAGGSVTFSADIQASTPGTILPLTQQGIFGPSGTWTDPAHPPTTPTYHGKLVQGQEAGVVLNMIDFCTGQLFDWFLAGNSAFTLIERLPSNVSGNTANPGCPGAESVGRDKMYTQIVDNLPLGPGKHNVSIT